MDLPPLRYKNGTFKIMVIGDLHEPAGKLDHPEKTQDAMRLLSAAADFMKPDLAVYAGDQGKSDDEAEMRELVRRITAPLAERNIPCALVFGNHDRECTLPLSRQLEIYREEYGNFYTTDDAPDLPGCGHCCVPVYDETGETVLQYLWFADSLGGYPDPAVSPYDWMKPEQVAWYKKTAALHRERDGKTVPALWFMHIPVREEYDLLRAAKWYEYPWSVKGFAGRSGRRYVPKDRSIGYLGEDPACAAVNSGIFEAWKETGDVKAAFFGHDHMNDFAGEVDGILLCQCKTAGFYPYTDGCSGGVRLVTLKADAPGTIDTRMVRFKDLGLKSESLGPVMRHFHDRQVINIHAAAIAGGAVLGLLGLGFGLARLLKKGGSQ